MFDQVTRLKLRFETSRGAISVEDLWDLPLKSETGRPNLDDVAKGIARQMKADGDVGSFVDDVAKPNSLGQLMLDTVKHVIAVRKQEAADKAKERERAATKQRIMEILAEKQDDALKGKSEQELTALLATM